MQVREWCATGEEWAGLYPWKEFHKVFKKVPTIDDLQNVPPAQRKDMKDTTAKWRAKIRGDVESVIKSRRVPHVHAEDLRYSH